MKGFLLFENKINISEYFVLLRKKVIKKVIIRINVKQLLKLFFTIIAYYFIILCKSHPFLLSIISLLFTLFDNLIPRIPAAYHWSNEPSNHFYLSMSRHVSTSAFSRGRPDESFIAEE